MKNSYFTKMILIFFLYFLLSSFGNGFLTNIGISNLITRMFFIDAIFLLIAIILFYKELKADFKKIKGKKVIKKIIIWLLIIFGCSLLIDFLLSFIPDIIPNFGKITDGNNSKIERLFKVSKLYVIFKTLIFASIAEDILYKLSVRKVIKNDFLFVIISSLIYTFLNLIFIDFGNHNYVLIYALFYRFIPEIIFSTAYVRIDNNIFASMIIKMIYNLLPLAALFLM